MKTQEIVNKAKKSVDVKIEFNPRTNYCVLTGRYDGNAFYCAIPRRAFNALKDKGLILQEPYGNYGPEIWRFYERDVSL